MTNKQILKKENTTKISNVPLCVGIIMDGNRRWAKENGLLTAEGHRRGYKKFKHVIKWAKEYGVKNVIIYGFSTENWNRSKTEVNALMSLFREMIGDVLKIAKRENIKISFLGQLNRFADDLQEGMKRVARETSTYTSGHLGIALSYGGRAEILQAIQKISASELATLNEKTFSQKLLTSNFPDPDLIIRTSGEKRLSGFLPWQSVYSELFFVKTFWPAFSKRHFYNILNEYSTRVRRLGK